MNIEKQIRPGLPQVGVPPYGQIHAHSTGNPTSTAQNEADYHMVRPVNSGFFSHVVGNGRVIQTAPVNRGAYDVGGGWNSWGYAHVELIESHKTQAEFDLDYKLYVELLRQLADEARLPKTLDTGNTGIITHEYATYHQPNNKSDHVDPYPYLAKWGISRAQFKKDVENGLGTSAPSKPSTPSQPDTPNITVKGDEEIMFIYEKKQKSGKGTDVYFVFGDKRMHLANATWVKEAQDLIKRYGGSTNRQVYGNDNFGVRMIEASTTLVKP